MKRLLLIATAAALVLAICGTAQGTHSNGHRFEDRRLDRGRSEEFDRNDFRDFDHRRFDFDQDDFRRLDDCVFDRYCFDGGHTGVMA